MVGECLFNITLCMHAERMNKNGKTLLMLYALLGGVKGLMINDVDAAAAADDDDDDDGSLSWFQVHTNRWHCVKYIKNEIR